MDHFWTFFSFPLNILLAILWFMAWWMIWRNKSECAAVRFLLSPYATISSLILLLVAGLLIGFLNDVRIVKSLPFALVILYILTVVYLITLRGWKRPGCKIRWRFLLIHAGFLLAVGAGFFGAPDSHELRIQLQKGQSSHLAYEMNGSQRGLGYELKLIDCKTEYSMSGKPSHYEAEIAVDEDDDIIITVNHPYNVGFGEDIYLASISDGGCVLQIIYEPWRYFALAGIIMLIAGAFMLFIGGPRR